MKCVSAAEPRCGGDVDALAAPEIRESHTGIVVFVGVAHVTDPGGGQPEPVVVMRRNPDSLRLASMVQREKRYRYPQDIEWTVVAAS